MVLDPVFSELKCLFSPRQLSKFIATPPDRLAIYHFGLGTMIRNRFLYPSDSSLFALYDSLEIEDVNDISKFIIRALHRELRRNQPQA